MFCQGVTTATASGEELPPRKVLLPRKSNTPLLPQTVAWHGFQVEQQPVACQVVSGWIKRLRDRDLVMPICEGLLEQGWIEANGLMPHAQHHDLREQLWLLLPSGPVPQSREARHLIRTLRQRVLKVGECQAGAPKPSESQAVEAVTTLQAEQNQGIPRKLCRKRIGTPSTGWGSCGDGSLAAVERRRLQTAFLLAMSIALFTAVPLGLRRMPRTLGRGTNACPRTAQRRTG